MRGLTEYLGTSLWFVPVLCVCAAIGLSAVTLSFDRGEAQGALAFTGSGESARSVLSTIATSITTLTALAFSVTVVVLQLASSQYSPRVLRTFLRDRRSQLVLGVFLGTFAYTMLVLREVRVGEDARSQFVPGLSIHGAYALMALSLLFFVLYIHHMGKSMQASHIVAEVAAETAGTLQRMYPTAGDDPERHERARSQEDGGRVMISDASGYLQAVDEQFLFDLAGDARVTLRLVPSIGDFVAAGSKLFVVTGELDGEQSQSVRDSVTLGRQRTMRQNPTFGFRQLVDIAEKALSPGINDPTTAVEAVDRLHELLLVLAPRQLPLPEREDGDGVVRLVLPRPDWDAFVHLAFDEIRQYGEGSIQVTRRLREAVNDLLEVVPPPRRDALERQRELLDRAARRGFGDPEDSDLARKPSRHG